jgi:hypothetical protein
VQGVIGNREVPRSEILGARADRSGAWAEACSGREGDSWGKHGFPHASEPEAREAVA